jgi:hypothetical protein
MLADVMLIDKYIGNAVGAVEFEIDALALPSIVDKEALRVAAGAAEVILFARKGVLGVPSVGQVDTLTGVLLHLMIESEGPIVIEREHGAFGGSVGAEGKKEPKEAASHEAQMDAFHKVYSF